MRASACTKARAARTQGWLAGLLRFLYDVGVSRELGEQTLGRLRAAGVTEERLRATVTAEELRGMGILLGPRSQEGRMCVCGIRNRGGVFALFAKLPHSVHSTMLRYNNNGKHSFFSGFKGRFSFFREYRF